MRVLGIDPGSLFLGWGFIETTKDLEISSVQHGCLKAHNRHDFLARLPLLAQQLDNLVTELRPSVTVIEKIFLGKNVDSAFKLGHVRGLCAVQCQKYGSPVVEYSARTVKKQITGSGSAEKNVVQNFLYQQLKITQNFESQDASDALALAFCHVLQDSVNRKFQRIGV